MSKEQASAERTPDEIERKIYGGEYAHDVTLRQLYGDLSLDEIKRIPKFKRDNHALFGLMVTAEVVTHKEGRGLIHQAMVDNYLRDFPLVRFYDAYRKKSPTTAQPDYAEFLAAIQKAISDIQADTTATALNAETISNGVDFLVQDRKGKIKANSQRGKECRAKGDTKEAARAARDMADALKKIAADPDVKANRYGAIIAACRRLCD